MKVFLLLLATVCLFQRQASCQNAFYDAQYITNWYNLTDEQFIGSPESTTKVAKLRILDSINSKIQSYYLSAEAPEQRSNSKFEGCRSFISCQTHLLSQNSAIFTGDAMAAENLKTTNLSLVRKLIASTPFLVVLCVLVHTWYEFLTNQYVASTVHYITLVLLLLNGVLLLIRFKAGLLLTGLLLLLAGFGLLFYFHDTSSTLTIVGLTIPFEGWSFLIFLVYLVVNMEILIKWKMEAK